MPQGRFSAYPAVFGSTLTATDVISSDLQTGISEIAELVAGTIDIGARAVASQDLRVKLAVLNLAHLGTVSPTVGVAINGQTLIQHQRRADGGVFDSDDHVTLKFFKGFLLPESIEASQDSAQAARLMLDFYGLYDGSNAPLTILSQALSGTPASAPTIYRLGPTYINGELVEANRSTRVNFGLEYKTTRGNGEIVAREGSIYTRKPTINIEPTDLGTVLDWTDGTQTRLSGNVVCFFQKEGVAFGTAQHLSVTIVQPTAEIGNIAAGITDDPRPGVILKPTAGALISVNTATAIAAP